MKNLLLTAVLTISSIAIIGQEAKVSADKAEYKFDEIIDLTFELNAKFDSIDLPDFKGFRIISGPTKNSSVSIKSGEQTVRESMTFRLRPTESGRLTIKSSTYYVAGKKIRGKALKIKVDPSNLTAEELEEKMFDEFVKDGIKPAGTTRIVLHENRGYIEIFGETGWEFYRRLTLEEIEEINKME